MQTHLQHRRDQAMQRIWDLQDSGLPDSSPQVVAAAQSAIAELRQVLREAGPDADPAESGLTWKYQGDAWFTLREAGQGHEALLEARKAYVAGEPILEAAGATLPLAKLNLNLANTLRVIDGGYNRTHMEEARVRYQRAARLFQQANPSAVPAVLELLQNLEIAIRALGFYEKASGEVSHARELQARLEQAGTDPGADILRSIQQEIEPMQTSLAEDASSAGSFLRQSAPLMAPQSAGLAGRMEELARQLTENASEPNPDAALFEQAQGVLDEALRSGEGTPERVAAMRAILGQFQELTGQPARTASQLAAKSVAMHEHINRFKSMVTTPRAHENSHAQKIAELFSVARTFIFDQSNQPGFGEVERNTAFQFMLESGHASHALGQANDAAALRAVEHDHMRPLLHGLREFALRRHLMVAEPFWGWPAVEFNPNQVFFAGSDAIRKTVTALCGERGLDLARAPASWGAGQTRWNQLRACGLAIFDLTPESRAQWPSIYHALGTALALGVQPFIISSAPLPFDVDIVPAPPDGSLGYALDAALYTIPQTSGSGSIAETAQQVLARCHSQDVETRVVGRGLANVDGMDPLEAGKSLDLLAARNGEGKWGLLRSTWPAFYPAAGDRRCFHVMPFSEQWSDGASAATRRACRAGIAYRRADQTPDPNIIRSIWEEICRAERVVVDLSGLNLNVCLELGLCQAAGRPTLLVRRKQAAAELFPEVAKLQVKTYHDDAALTGLVESFLAAP